LPLAPSIHLDEITPTAAKAILKKAALVSRHLAVQQQQCTPV